MNIKYLEFEQSIAELEEKINELRRVTHDRDINISDEIARLTAKNEELTRSIFSSLSDFIGTGIFYPHLIRLLYLINLL